MDELEKKICILAHIYDFIHGGCFASHHQLRYYDDKIYDLYLNNDKTQLINLYNELKKEISLNIVKNIEKSAGIRYFLCDGCHDAKVENVSYKEKNYKSSYLIIDLNTENMLGCLSLKNNYCKIKLETYKKEECQSIINDFNNSEKLYWLSSSIQFENNEMYFIIELQSFKGKTNEILNYKFKIFNVLIEQ